MSLVGEDDRLDDENVEYNHRDESGDEKSEDGGEAIELIREIVLNFVDHHPSDTTLA